MKACCLVALFVLALVLGCGSSAAQSQNEVQSQKPENTEKQAAQLKLVKAPTAPYPEEALKKNIEGKVVLSIVVNAKGKVSDAKVLSGAPELIQAAIDSVKQWEFEPPAQAPVVTNAEVAYGHPKECPGSISDSGEVIFPGWFKNEKGTVIVTDDTVGQSPPPYFTEDRKAGVGGEMILLITVSAKGEVAKTRVVKSLSPHLDKAAITTVRAWKFKLLSGNPDSLPDDFQLHITYMPTCKPQF
jgi:TonB family protein